MIKQTRQPYIQYTIQADKKWAERPISMFSYTDNITIGIVLYVKYSCINISFTLVLSKIPIVFLTVSQLKIVPSCFRNFAKELLFGKSVRIIEFYDPRHNGEGIVCLLDCPLHLYQILIYLILDVRKKKPSRKQCLPRSLNIFCTSILSFCTSGTNRGD